jgi:predicted dehydrogenase
MKRIILFMLAAIPLFSCVQNDGIIRTDVPERPAGQEHVLGLVTEPLDTVRVGFVGLGMRGPGAVYRFTHIPGVKIVALCDVEADRVSSAQNILMEAGLPEAAAYSGSTEAYKEMCERDDIDLIYIATDWVHHAPVALYAMEHGKHAAIEVPAATTLD